MRQGSIAFFRQSFCMTLPKILLGNSPVFQNLSGCGKFEWMKEVEMKFFRRMFLNPSTRNFYWELFVVSESFCYVKKLMDEMGVSQISVLQILCHITGKFHWELFVVQQNCGSRKVAWKREGDITFSVAFFLYQSFENLHWETFVVSENFRQGKYFMKARGDITFSHLIFLVSHYRKLSLGTFRSFKNFRLANFLHGRERGKSRFSVAFFLYHSFENLHLEPIVVSENFWQGKLVHECEGGYHVFPSSFPRFILPKTSFGNSSVFQKLSVSEKKTQ